MNKSSNSNMNQVFECLANIKMAEPSNNLYAQTINKLQMQNTISLFWVKALACLLIAFISTELYIVSKNDNKNQADISNVIATTNNILYNE